MKKLILPLLLVALFVAGCPRVVTQIPLPTQYTEKQVAVNSQITFSVTAEGTQPFTYQWHKNAVAIAGATAVNYVIAAVKNEDSGDYTCMVSNSAGGTLSDTMRINVSNKPSNVVVSAFIVPK